MVKIINTSPEFGNALTEQQINEFLTSTKLNVHLGTIDDNNYLNVHPTLYYFDLVNKKIFIKHYFRRDYFKIYTISKKIFLFISIS
jgi:hypothetical protein